MNTRFVWLRPRRANGFITYGFRGKASSATSTNGIQCCQLTATSRPMECWNHFPLVRHSGYSDTLQHHQLDLGTRDQHKLTDTLHRQLLEAGLKTFACSWKTSILILQVSSSKCAFRPWPQYAWESSISPESRRQFYATLHHSVVPDTLKQRTPIFKRLLRSMSYS